MKKLIAVVFVLSFLPHANAGVVKFSARHVVRPVAKQSYRAVKFSAKASFKAAKFAKKVVY